MFKIRTQPEKQFLLYGTYYNIVTLLSSFTRFLKTDIFFNWKYFILYSGPFCDLWKNSVFGNRWKYFIKYGLSWRKSTCNIIENQKWATCITRIERFNNITIYEVGHNRSIRWINWYCLTYAVWTSGSNIIIFKKSWSIEGESTLHGG